MTGQGWELADEWFAEYISELERSGRRKRKLFREKRAPIPEAELKARAFAEKTEQLRRYLEHEMKKAVAA